MRNFLGGTALAVGLVACSRPPPTVEAAADPSAEQVTPGTPSASPSAAPSAAPATGAAEGERLGRRAGGSCEYEETPGTATVATIEDVDAGPDCKRAKTVRLKFVPDDPAAKSERLDSGFTLGVGGMSFVPAGCLAELKIAVGTKLPVVRRKIKSGGCTPLGYDPTVLSSEDAVTKCVAHCN
jgi:hypothetical protein